MTGVAMAPTSIVTVSAHCAVETATWSSAAMVGMSGAPRLLTTATSMPSETRTGTRARGWRSADADTAEVRADAGMEGCKGNIPFLSSGDVIE